MLYKTKPYDHQHEALTRSLDAPYFALLMEMGTGKSKVLIDTLANLYIKGAINFALVVAPKGVYSNWPNKEIPEHLHEDVPVRIIQWKAAPTKAEAAELRTLSQPFDGLTILIMNVEAFSSLKGQKMAAWLARHYGDSGLCAVDESTTIKNPKAKRTKTLCNMAMSFKYRRILTGSPVTKCPLDLFGQAAFLRAGLLGTSYFSFQSEYCITKRRVMGAHSFNQIVGYRNMDQLAERIRSWSYRKLKRECLDLPEKIYTTRTVALTPEQKRTYESMKKVSVSMLDSGELVTAQQAVTQMLRLQQILSGFVTTEDGDLSVITSGRITALLELLEETSGKVIIWSRFRHDIEQITAELQKAYGKGSAASYYGSTPQDDRERIVKTFQTADSELRFFVGNPQTAGYGLTLTEASTVVYYANSFDLEHRLQSEDRAHRIGQRNSVTYVDLIAPDTIDEKIVEALRQKINLSARVLGEQAMKWLT